MSDATNGPLGASGVPPKGDKRRVRQAPQRASYAPDTLRAVLDACPIGHVAFVHEGWPQSIPTAIARLDDHLYLHGSRKSRLYRALASGARACISVCRVDALVKARSAFHCSMNYRSAVVFGCGEVVDDPEDVELPHWAGIVPIESAYGRPVPSADLPGGVVPPAALLKGARP